jgi:hypothetical protein
MAESSPPPPSAPPGVPRWLKVSAIVAGVIVLVLVLLAITGVLGGQHGPGRHGPGGEPPAGVTEPPGAHIPPGYRGP